MLQKISDNDEKWEKAEEEVTQVIAQHSVIQAKLEEQEQLTFTEEERTRVSDIMCIISMDYCVKCEIPVISPVLFSSLSVLHR